ncbi:complexed with cef1p [Coemansia aciculifera]|uniref:Complexed with cef1p n=1 Tax=Coemansia aciculifera TaxID=417176 RepID=A0ACC1LXQ4_9FUNG|nr:complexed with cef1p [Coemansia aciculifera]KAJ2910284.1 complexed with cef1p [Coemansia aciculifera]
MTTAARPTFNPAKGKAPDELTFMTSAKDLPSHTKLKTRKPGQGIQDEYTIEDLKRELVEAEQAHSRAKRQITDSDGGSSSGVSEENRAQLESAKMRYIEMAQRLDAASDDEGSEGSDNGSDDEDEDDANEDGDSDDDSEDETAMLMRELEKIKRERAEERVREEQDALERKLVDGDAAGKSSFLGENPLLANRDFSVKRRWDDDVVFKNQAQGDDGKPKKRFINDMLRSDFHRKFMKKYIH